MYAVQFENKTYRAYLIQPDGQVVSQTLDAKGKIVNPDNKRTATLTVRDGDIVLDFRDGAWSVWNAARRGSGSSSSVRRPTFQTRFRFLASG